MGNILNESRESQRIDDINELVLHVEDVQKKEVSRDVSKDIPTTVANSSNKDESIIKNKSVNFIYVDSTVEKYQQF